MVKDALEHSVKRRLSSLQVSPLQNHELLSEFEIQSAYVKAIHEKGTLLLFEDV